MKKRHKALLGIGFVLFGIPLILWLSWLVTTPRPVSIFIMDKTSFSEEKIKYRAINWVLMHYRFVKSNGKDYLSDKDYYGFFPVDSTNYVIRDLSKLNPTEIQRMAVQYQVAYYVDNYGVYTDVWPVGNTSDGPVEKIYGGLEWTDLMFLDQMLRMGRLVIAEFIFFAPPTQPAIRKSAEELLGIQWQGWSGRYFHTLDLNARDGQVPGWMPTLYESQYGEPWQFRNAGVVLVHEDETLVVLEQSNHLFNAQPLIRTSNNERDFYGVIDKIGYPGWFDITLPTSPTQTVVSWYELDLTEAGVQLIKEHNIPDRIPAVIRDDGPNRMYYFAGDFGQSPVRRRFVRLKGARFAELFLSDLNDPTDQSGFFLTFYLPMIRKILREYQEIVASE